MGVVCEYPDTTYDLEYHLSTFRILSVVTSVFGDMLHSTHGIDHYPCSRTNRIVCENGGNCYTDASPDDGYFYKL